MACACNWWAVADDVGALGNLLLKIADAAFEHRLFSYIADAGTGSAAYMPAVDLFTTSACCAAQPLPNTGTTCLMQVDPNVPLFGYIGRLEEQKGVDILMAALPKALAGVWRATQDLR